MIKELLCKECQKLTMVNVVKGERCFHCDARHITNIEFGRLCSKCADNMGRCIRCGTDRRRDNGKK